MLKAPSYTASRTVSIRARSSMSPDGNQVAFAWNGEKGDNTDIYIMPVGAGTPVRLTTDPAEDTVPAWSPDGSQIAFVRRQGTRGAVYLTTPPVPNSEQKLTDIRPVALLNNDVTTVSWFPDGNGWPSLTATLTAK